VLGRFSFPDERGNLVGLTAEGDIVVAISVVKERFPTTTALLPPAVSEQNALFPIAVFAVSVWLLGRAKYQQQVLAASDPMSDSERAKNHVKDVNAIRRRHQSLLIAGNVSHVLSRSLFTPSRNHTHPKLARCSFQFHGVFYRQRQLALPQSQARDK
jgi:hypothetical protein